MTNDIFSNRLINHIACLTGHTSQLNWLKCNFNLESYPYGKKVIRENIIQLTGK